MEDFLIQHTNEAYIECIKLYFTLNDSQQKFFDNQNEFWHDILSILSGIQIIHGYKPSLDVIHAAFCGYYTTFTLTNEYGEYYEAPNYAILNGIRLDVMTQRPISIWQAYLFVNMTRIFCQLHRAPQYAAIPIFSLKDLDKIQITIPAIEKIKIGYSCFRKDVFIPVVKLVDEDTYGGMVKNLCQAYSLERRKIKNFVSLTPCSLVLNALILELMDSAEAFVDLLLKKLIISSECS